MTTNRRNLGRAVWRAIEQTWVEGSTEYGNGSVTVVAVFTPDSFPDAPSWSPGPGFVPCISDLSWIRRHGDGSMDVVATDVGAMTFPAWDGGEWKGSEVWSATLPEGHDYPWWLWDRPHRIVWERKNPAVRIRREPYATHPSRTVRNYWRAFGDEHGFMPEESAVGDQILYGPGSRWAVLECHPAEPGLPDVDDLLHHALALHQEFGARLRVYPFNSRRRTSAPMGEGYDVLKELVRRAARASAGREKGKDHEP